MGKGASGKISGMSRMLENIRQLRAKQGPYYEKWKQGILRFAEKLKQEEGGLKGWLNRLKRKRKKKR